MFCLLVWTPFKKDICIKMSTMKPKLFGIQIWWYQTFLLTHLSKPTGQKICKVRKQQKKIQFCQSYSYVNRNVWYHQIWIPNNLGFIVSDLLFGLKVTVHKFPLHKQSENMKMCYYLTKTVYCSHLYSWYWMLQIIDEIQVIMGHMI